LFDVSWLFVLVSLNFDQEELVDADAENSGRPGARGCQIIFSNQKYPFG
jgi:hypothetical protein